MNMASVMVTLRNVAGVMFWGLTDLLLGMVWAVLIFGILRAVVKGFGSDDD